MKSDNILQNISYHAVYEDSIMDALRYARSNGFTGIQLACEVPRFSYEGVSAQACAEILDFVQRNQMSIALHAPDETVSLLETNGYLRQGIFDYYSALFRFAENIGANLVTIHLGSLPSWKTDTTPEQALPKAALSAYLERLSQSLHDITRLVRGRFLLVCENYKLDEMILDTLGPFVDAGELFLCWDLAKTFDRDGTKDETLEKYFWNHLSQVKQVHLHDYWSEPPRQHRVIGTGFIDFMDFLPRLSEADIADYCIEVRPREKALESLTALRCLLKGGVS